MPLHIGIVGCSAEGAALCYRTICQEGAKQLHGHHHPEVSMHTHSFGDYVRYMENDDWHGVADLMVSSTEKLKHGGADFVICPDNTSHKAFPFLADRSPLPWLHIADVVAQEGKTRGYKQLGLTGTRWLTESDVYPDRIANLGMTCLIPSQDHRIEMGRIIMEELVFGVFDPSSVAIFQCVIEDLRNTGADAVILGCTEIPLIIDDSNSSLPTLDSTRLLARAALRRAIDLR